MTAKQQKEKAELMRLLSNREWRMSNLYHIEDKEGRLIRFCPNEAQKWLAEHLWYRNEILKARQMGFSTYVALLMLDSCLFTGRFRCGIIDKTLDDAKLKLGKIRLAYETLDYAEPGASKRELSLSIVGGEIKKAVSVIKNKETMLEFGNGSGVRCGTSMRGGTLQMLHVSELAHVAHHNPIRAREIKTGALQAVAEDCYVIKESTHEGGRSGINYEMVCRAMSNTGRKLGHGDYRFFFFPWWRHSAYRSKAEYWTTEPQAVTESGAPNPYYKQQIAERSQLIEYFEQLKEKGIELDDSQKAWYATKRRELDFAIRQEYPSTPDEAFDILAERSIYAGSISVLQASGDWAAEFEPDDYAPYYVSWDLGTCDATSLWLVQACAGGKYLWLEHYSASGKTIDHYAGIVRSWETRYRMQVAMHFLPHDAGNSTPANQGMTFARSAEAAGMTCTVLPRISDVWVGIGYLRQIMRHSRFHERCAIAHEVDGKEYPSGLQALENYQTAPDGAHGRLGTAPLHDRYSHSADAARYFAEAAEGGYVAGRDEGESRRNEPRQAYGVSW